MKEQAIKAKGEADVAQLLKPRYKVIAEWPGKMIDKVGDIIEGDYCFYWEGNRQLTDKCDKYPHLFRKLFWHEEREASEMPEYMKFKISDVIHKVDEHINGVGFYWDGWKYKSLYQDAEPATETEYNQYLKTKQK